LLAIDAGGLGVVGLVFGDRAGDDLASGGVELQDRVALQMLTDELSDAEPDPFITLRYVHLSREQADYLKTMLSELVDGVAGAEASEPKYRLLVGLSGPAQ